ncbi:MAG: transporter substrate-binding domain-containing protein, partial [Myxococcota bacterium]
TERRQIAWAVRKNNRKLRDALNRYLQGLALTVHTRVTATPDLEGIKKRGVLRVLTRNNALTYLLYRGAQFGFDFDMAKLVAEAIGVRLEVLVVPSRDQLIPWLLEGRGDMIAASMTMTDARKEQVAFSRPYLYTDEIIVVRRRSRDAPQTIEDLAGRTVYVRPSSSYAQTLKKLQASGIDVKIADVPEEMETEEIIEAVAKKKFDLTVADRHILNVELTYGTRVKAGPALTQAPEEKLEGRRFKADGGKEIGFAMRPDSTQLKAFVDDWLDKNYRGRRYNILKRRYLSSGRAVRRYKRRAGRTGKISSYDEVIKKYASRYGFDWRLMAAQAFVESRFNTKARSWVGAKGLFQVMPRTGASMGFYKLEDPEIGTHAGIKYMDRLVRRFDPKLPFRQRVRFALAAYNAGLGHVIDARNLARKKGWNPDRWFGNVEKAMLLLSDKKYYRKARYGYCRGKEPVAYVSHIQAKYQAYAEVTKQ